MEREAHLGQLEHLFWERVGAGGIKDKEGTSEGGWCDQKPRTPFSTLPNTVTGAAAPCTVQAGRVFCLFRLLARCHPVLAAFLFRLAVSFRLQMFAKLHGMNHPALARGVFQALEDACQVSRDVPSCAACW